jgi:hypothetical protein
MVVYPDAKAAAVDAGIRLTPGRPHVSKLPANE